MNLQEHIRRILKEETYFKVSNDDYSDLIKDAVLSYVDFNICALVVQQLEGHKDQYLVILIVEKQLKSSYREELQDFLNKYIPLKYIYVSISDGQDCQKYKKGRSQQEQISRIHEAMGIKDMIKNLLGKKPLTKDDKLVNLIVKFIEETHSIDFSSNDYGEVTFYLTDDTGVWLTPIMKYFPKYKRLEYKWSFAKDIHDWIGDDRLLHLDSEMMGKIFEKMFNRKVDKVNGYSRL